MAAWRSLTVANGRRPDAASATQGASSNTSPTAEAKAAGSMRLSSARLVMACDLARLHRRLYSPASQSREAPMTQNRLTRRRFGVAAGAMIGAPLPLRFASAQAAPADLKVALLLPTSGAQALIGQACRRGADVANEVLADSK